MYNVHDWMVAERNKFTVLAGWTCPGCGCINSPQTTRCICNYINEQQRKSTYLSLVRISEVVCDYYKLPYDALEHLTRERPIVQARQIAWFFAKEFTPHRYERIAFVIGRKDRNTARHGVEKTVVNLIQTDVLYRQEIIKIRQILLNEENKLHKKEHNTA